MVYSVTPADNSGNPAANCPTPFVYAETPPESLSRPGASWPTPFVYSPRPLTSVVEPSASCWLPEAALFKLSVIVWLPDSSF